MVVARVLPNVTGLDKQFDYVVGTELAGQLAVGDVVRVDLHGRRVAAWVVALDPPDALAPTALKPVVKRTGCGPSADLIELAEWAAHRWLARRRSFLVSATPERAVRTLPGRRRSGAVVEPRSPASTALLESGGGVLRLPPASDPRPAILSATALGPTLVVVPGVDQALLLAAGFRRAGLACAVVPDEWAAAAGGVDVVIGSRSAAWAPCPDLAAAVIVDEHDEALQEEGSPTWHAREVVLERCRRSGVPALLISPCPTVTALQTGPLTRPPRDRERAGWPIVDVIDRGGQEPWRRSLLTTELIRHLRDPDRVVVCVSNTPGRARLLACRSCRQIARCERCDAAVALLDADGTSDRERDRESGTDDAATAARGAQLVCPRCAMQRPPVCRVCGAGRFANLRPGVTRLREELAAAAGRPAVLVTGAGSQHPERAAVYVGTEAVLHRVERADTVAFLDFDSELLAPRYQAPEQALALVVRAARLVGPRAGGGRVLLQTYLPDHPVVQAALLADPGRLAEVETAKRRMLALPPFGALAEVSGAGSDDFVAGLALPPDVTLAGSGGHYLLRAPDWSALAAALSGAVRPPGSRLRIAVDPAR